MAEVRVAHTADLAPGESAAIRELLYDVFDDLDESDYEHALGGVHAFVEDDGRVLAHASVIMRRLLHDGRSLRTGYVEGVAVRAEHRRRGLGSLVMDPLERVIRRGYQLGALGASDEGVPFYLARGWTRWPGTASVVGPRGIERTPAEEGAIYLLPLRAQLRPDGDLACDWRDGDVW